MGRSPLPKRMIFKKFQTAPSLLDFAKKIENFQQKVGFRIFVVANIGLFYIFSW